MRLAVDTNVLVHAEGFGDLVRCRRANRLMHALATAPVVLPVQVLGELFRVLHCRFRLEAGEVRTRVARWSDVHAVGDCRRASLDDAFDLVVDHGLAVWDALVLAVSSEHRCRILLTEDLRHGFTWRGVTVVDPFAEPAHALLAEALAGRGR